MFGCKLALRVILARDKFYMKYKVTFQLHSIASIQSLTLLQ